MSYWKSKVLPKLKKIFDKGKKKGASDVCKSFDKSKESLEKEIGEKAPDLQPKVVEIYRSSAVISKKLLKDPSEPAVKENSDAVQTILQELVKAGFPGAHVLSEAGSKFGTALLPGPIVYLFGKTSTFLVEEPLPVEEPREIVVEEGKAAEEPVKVEETSASVPPPPAPEPEAGAVEEKTDEMPAEVVIESTAAGEVSTEIPPPLPPAEVVVEKVEEVPALAEPVPPPPAPEKSESTPVPVKAEP